MSEKRHPKIVTSGNLQDDDTGGGKMQRVGTENNELQDEGREGWRQGGVSV